MNDLAADLLNVAIKVKRQPRYATSPCLFPQNSLYPMN